MDIGRSNVLPTDHFLKYHSDVDWDLVLDTVISPHISRQNKRLGNDRFTYIRKFKKFVIEIHAIKIENECKILVINAFKMVR